MSNEWIISSSEFKSGFFPKVPAVTKGKAVLLKSNITGGLIHVTDKVTPREVSTGKYDEIILIDLTEKKIEVNYLLPSKEIAYNFDVKITIGIKIINPLEFYEENIDDMEYYINSELKPTLKKSSQYFSVMDYNGIDDYIIDELKIKKHNMRFISLRFINADCQPNEYAKEYIKRISDEEMEKKVEINKHKNQMDIEKSKLENAKVLLNVDMKTAMYTKVVAGEISIEDTIKKLNEYNQEVGDRNIANMLNVIKVITSTNSDYISDVESEKLIKGLLSDITEALPQSNKGNQTLFPNMETSDSAYNDIINDNDEENEGDNTILDEEITDV